MSLQKNNYAEIVLGLKQKIREARIKASVAVNIYLLETYWEIGNTILQLQVQKKWGAKVIDTLAGYLKLEFPDSKGLSVRNLKYMRAFAEAYPNFAVSNLQPLKQDPLFVQSLVAQNQIVDNQYYEILKKILRNKCLNQFKLVR